MQTRVAGGAVAILLVGLTAWLLLRDSDREAGDPEASRSLAEETGNTPAPAVESQDVGLRGGSRAGGEAAEPSPTEARKPAEPREGEVRVKGVVVDERKKPVAGVEVIVETKQEALGRTTTGDDGAFALDVAIPPGAGPLFAQARARSGERAGAAGLVLRGDPMWGAFRPPSGEIDVETVRLGPVHALEVHVVRECPSGPPATLVATTLEGAGLGGFSRGECDAEGRCRIEGLRAGTYRVTALAPGCGRAVGVTAVPREEAGTLILTLGAERVVEVRVLEDGSDAPIAGARVGVSETFRLAAGMGTSGTVDVDVPPTDADGRTTIRGLGASDLVSLNARAEGFSVLPVGDRRIVAKPGEDRVEIRLTRLRRIEFPVVAGERPVPPDGTALRLVPEPGRMTPSVPKSGTIEGGRIVVEGFESGSVGCLALTPDGSIARLFAKEGESVGSETSFRASRTLEVVLRYPDGTPAEGVRVSLRNQGNNPLAGPTATDSAGEARFEELYGGLMSVFAGDGNSPYGGLSVGTADLEKGPTRVEATVERRRRFLLTVRAAGETRLPEGFAVGAGLAVAEIEAEDAERGTVLFAWRPPPRAASDPPPSLTMAAPGYLQTTVPVPLDVVANPIPMEVSLEPAARVVLRVVPPTGHFRIESHRWDESTRSWAYGGHDSGVMGAGQLRIDATGIGRIDSLPPDRYRFVDVTSGASTEAVSLTAGGEPHEVRLDLTRAGAVSGRVVAPPGESLRGAVVRRVGTESLSTFGRYGSGGNVAEDGSFSVRVPGTTEVVLEVSHPTLAPAEPGGRISVTTPVSGVELRLVKGNRATVRFDGAVDIRSWGVEAPSVLLYANEPEGEPAARCRIALEERTISFGGYAPGTYTLWVDTGPWEPVVIRDAVLGPGDTDLGTVSLSKGRSIVVEILAKEGQAVPRLGITASRKTEPKYHRWTDTSREPRLTGLGPGVFDVIVTGQTTGQRRLTATVDLTTVTEARVTVDLR
jgi:hypothetical protein